MQVGLYLGCNDPLGRLKMLPTNVSGSTAVMRALHTPDQGFNAAGQPMALPYTVSLRVFQTADTVSPWWDAAQYYRQWALPKADWTRRGPLKTRPGFPTWMFSTGLWVVGGSDDWHVPTSQVADTVDQFKAVLKLGA